MLLSPNGQFTLFLPTMGRISPYKCHVTTGGRNRVNKIKLDQQNRKQALRVYSPNTYTVWPTVMAALIAKDALANPGKHFFKQTTYISSKLKVRVCTEGAYKPLFITILA